MPARGYGKWDMYYVSYGWGMKWIWDGHWRIGNWTNSMGPAGIEKGLKTGVIFGEWFGGFRCPCISRGFFSIRISTLQLFSFYLLSKTVFALLDKQHFCSILPHYTTNRYPGGICLDRTQSLSSLQHPLHIPLFPCPIFAPSRDLPLPNDLACVPLRNYFPTQNLQRTDTRQHTFLPLTFQKRQGCSVV
jgi:hypothetical protein